MYKIATEMFMKCCIYIKYICFAWSYFLVNIYSSVFISLSQFVNQKVLIHTCTLKNNSNRKNVDNCLESEQPFINFFVKALQALLDLITPLPKFSPHNTNTMIPYSLINFPPWMLLSVWRQLLQKRCEPHFSHWTGSFPTRSQVLSRKWNGHVRWQSSRRYPELCPRPRARSVLSTRYVCRFPSSFIQIMRFFSLIFFQVCFP